MNTALPQNFLPFGSLAHATSKPNNASASADMSNLDPAARAEAQFARRVVSHLDDSASEVPHDVSERLRFARDLALQRARLARVAAAAASVSVAADGSMVLHAAGTGQRIDQRPGRNRWWLRLAAVVPLFTLVGGLIVIQHLHSVEQIKAAADIDAALLVDDLPPAAYADPAFAEYLRAPRD